MRILAIILLFAFAGCEGTQPVGTAKIQGLLTVPENELRITLLIEKLNQRIDEYQAKHIVDSLALDNALNELDNKSPARMTIQTVSLVNELQAQVVELKKKLAEMPVIICDTALNTITRGENNEYIIIPKH